MRRGAVPRRAAPSGLAVPAVCGTLRVRAIPRWVCAGGVAPRVAVIYRRRSAVPSRPLGPTLCWPHGRRWHQMALHHFVAPRPASPCPRSRRTPATIRRGGPLPVPARARRRRGDDVHPKKKQQKESKKENGARAEGNAVPMWKRLTVFRWGCAMAARTAAANCGRPRRRGGRSGRGRGRSVAGRPLTLAAECFGCCAAG